MMDVREWLSDDGFLSFYHKDHPEHGKPFADSCHNTGLWLMGEYIAGSMDRNELRRILEKGLSSRITEHGFLRYPGSNEYLNRDQVMFLIPLCYEVSLFESATIMRKKHMDFNLELPHWSDLFDNEDTWLGRMFEVGDALADRVNPRVTSIIKNVARLCWGEFKGSDHNSCAWKHLKAAMDPYRAIEIFGSRRPETWESKYDELPYPLSIESPSPIYLPWKGVVRHYVLSS